MNRNLEIDRLRAIVALVVLYMHFCIIYYPMATALTQQMFGASLLDLSFVISGYVISSILIRDIDVLSKNPSAVATFIKAYYIRRIYRIYPAAIVVFLGVLFCSIAFAHSYFSTPSNTIEAGTYIFTYTFNYYFLEKYHSLALAPYWTLVIEEQFYWLFPLFILFTKNNRQRIIILSGLLLLVTFIVRPLTLHYYPVEGVYFSQSRCDGFIYGYFIYCIMQQPWVNAIKFSPLGNKMLRTSCVVMLVYLMMAISVLNISPSVIIPIGLLIAFALATMAALECEIIVFSPGIQKALDIIGKRFYSLYLVHFPIIMLSRAIWDRYANQDPILYVTFSVIVLLSVAVVTELLYRLVEKPSLNMGKMISKQLYQERLQDISDGSTLHNEVALNLNR